MACVYFADDGSRRKGLSALAAALRESSRYCEKKAPHRLDSCAAAVLMHVTGAALELLF